MRTVMHRYAHAFFNQVAQSAACNHFHTLQQRCCRWLLMTHDRMQSDQFLLTQEFLAMMLGVLQSGMVLHFLAQANFSLADAARARPALQGCRRFSAHRRRSGEGRVAVASFGRGGSRYGPNPERLQ
jgi:hypothetical protein